MGRPRDAGIDRRLLEAARHLMATCGYDDMTMEAVARDAQVGKPALYRRYRSKAHLALELAVAASAPAPLPDTGSFETDMVVAVQALAGSIMGAPRGALADQIAQMTTDEEFAALVVERQMDPALEQVHLLWERAVARGEVPPEADGRQALRDLSAAVQVRILQHHAKLDDDAIAALVRRWSNGYRQAAGTPPPPVVMRAVGEGDRPWVTEQLSTAWGSTVVARLGEVIDAKDLDGAIAVVDGDPVGLVTWCWRAEELEIVTLQSALHGAGIGTALLDAVGVEAARGSATRVWLVTTNDNTVALRMYQRWGLDLVDVRLHGVDESRRLRSGIPEFGHDGIPLDHELVLACAGPHWPPRSRVGPAQPSR